MGKKKYGEVEKGGSRMMVRLKDEEIEKEGTRKIAR